MANVLEGEDFRFLNPLRCGWNDKCMGDSKMHGR